MRKIVSSKLEYFVNDIGYIIAENKYNNQKNLNLNFNDKIKLAFVTKQYDKAIDLINSSISIAKKVNELNELNKGKENLIAYLVTMDIINNKGCFYNEEIANLLNECITYYKKNKKIINYYNNYLKLIEYLSNFLNINNVIKAYKEHEIEKNKITFNIKLYDKVYSNFNLLSNKLLEEIDNSSNILLSNFDKYEKNYLKIYFLIKLNNIYISLNFNKKRTLINSFILKYASQSKKLLSFAIYVFCEISNDINIANVFNLKIKKYNDFLFIQNQLIKYKYIKNFVRVCNDDDIKKEKLCLLTVLNNLEKSKLGSSINKNNNIEENNKNYLNNTFSSILTEENYYKTEDMFQYFDLNQLEYIGIDVIKNNYFKEYHKKTFNKKIEKQYFDIFSRNCLFKHYIPNPYYSSLQHNFFKIVIYSDLFKLNVKSIEDDILNKNIYSNSSLTLFINNIKLSYLINYLQTLHNYLSIEDQQYIANCIEAHNNKFNYDKIYCNINNLPFILEVIPQISNIKFNKVINTTADKNKNSSKDSSVFLYNPWDNKLLNIEYYWTEDSFQYITIKMINPLSIKLHIYKLVLIIEGSAVVYNYPSMLLINNI